MINPLKNPHIVFVGGVTLTLVAIELTYRYIKNNPDIIPWIFLGAVALVFAVLPLIAYLYLIFGRYSRKSWNRRFSMSVGILYFSAALSAILLFVLLYVAAMSNGFELLPAPIFMYSLLAMLLFTSLAAIWAAKKLQRTFKKRYVYILLLMHTAPILLLAYILPPEGWTQLLQYGPPIVVAPQY